MASAQHLAGLGVHQMRLSARKAGHLDIREVVIIWFIRYPRLNTLACVWATVQDWSHLVSYVVSSLVGSSKATCASLQAKANNQNRRVLVHLAWSVVATNAGFLAAAILDILEDTACAPC